MSVLHVPAELADAGLLQEVITIEDNWLKTNLHSLLLSSYFAFMDSTFNVSLHLQPQFQLVKFEWATMKEKCSGIHRFLQAERTN